MPANETWREYMDRVRPQEPRDVIPLNPLLLGTEIYPPHRVWECSDCGRVFPPGENPSGAIVTNDAPHYVASLHCMECANAMMVRAKKEGR